MVCIGSICCEKFKQNIVARTVALIAPVCPVLLRVSCSSETVPNGPKQEETHQKHVFRVQWCGSGVFVVKNSKKTSRHELLHLLHQFVPFCFEFRGVPKRFQMHPKGKKRTET